MKLLINYLNKEEDEIDLNYYEIVTSNVMFIDKKDESKSISLDDIEKISFCEDSFIMEKVDKIIECLLIYKSQENRKIELGTYTKRKEK